MSNARERAVQNAENIAKRSGDLKSPSGIYNTYFDVPDTIPTWFAKSSPKGEDYFVDLVMFPVDLNFPWGVWKNPYKIGEWGYTMIVDIHKGVGAEGAWIICPKNNFGERCPICEDLQKLQREAPDKEAKRKVWEDLRVYRRQFYYVVVRDDGEEEAKGAQLWELPATYMHDKLDAIKYSGRGGEIVMYWHPDKGKTIKFNVKDKGEFPEFSGHQFVDRVDPRTKKPYVIDDELLDFAEANPPDKFLKRMNYDEVLTIYREEPAPSVETPTESDSPRRRARRSETPAPPVVEETPPETATLGCPSGLEFGVDTLKKKPCEECDDEFYQACKAKKEELEAAADTTPTRRKRRSLA